MPKPKLLTVKQAMDVLGVSQATMYRMLAERQLPHVKVRGRKQVNEADIERYIRENTSGSAEFADLKGIKRFEYVKDMKVVQ